MKNLLIGEILTEAGVLTEQQLQEALAAQGSEKTQRLGWLLLERGLLESAALYAALETQRTARLRQEIVSAFDSNYCVMPWQEQRQINAGGYKVNFVDTGSDKPMLVLLHGLSYSSVIFNPVISMLAQDFRIIAPDLPPYGTSGEFIDAEDDFSVDKCLHILLHFMDCLGEQKAHYVGASFGAHLLMKAAGKVPHKFASLTLSCPGGLFPREYIETRLNPVKSMLQQDKRFLHQVLSNLDTWRAGAAGLLYSINTPEKKNFISYAQDTPNHAFFSQTLNARATLRQSIMSSLLSVEDVERLQGSMPLHMIVALNDTVVSSEFLIKSYQHTVNTVTTVNRCGHEIYWDQPVAVTNAIKGFIHAK